MGSDAVVVASHFVLDKFQPALPMWGAANRSRAPLTVYLRVREGCDILEHDEARNMVLFQPALPVWGVT